MRCSCPKCDVIIEVQEEGLSAKGNSRHCPECSGKYWVQREHFMLRAFKKQGRIYCFDCGHELGVENLCMGCGSICPDYCVVQSSKPSVHVQQRAGFSFSLSRSQATKSTAPRLSSKRAAPHSDSEQKHQQPVNSKWLAYAGLAVLLLVLAGGVGKFYLAQKAEQQYAKDFIVALYGIKSGTDMCLESIDAISTEWQKSAESFNVAPRPTEKDLGRFATVKTRISEAMDKLNESPEKFVEARENLARLHKVYGEIYALSTSAPGSLGALTESKQKLETEFFKKADVLMTSMPEPLQGELRISVAKYRNLKFMVEKS